MTTSTELSRICPFCGKTIYYKKHVEDGIDWEGHQRGSYKDWTDKNTCECEDKTFRKMCVNCEYIGKDGETCFCKDVIRDCNAILTNNNLSFEIPVTLNGGIHLKKPTNHCKHWKLNVDLISKYFQ